MEESCFGLSVPVDTYGLAKYLIARELKSINNNSINLRLFGIFGNFEDYSRRFISNNICRSLAGLPVSLNKDMRFDYMDVNDLGRLIVDLLSRDSLVLGDYNFCTGRPLYLKEIGNLICKEMGQEAPIVVKQEGFNLEYSGNPDKLFSNIGDFKFTPIRDSIKKLADYYRGNMSTSDLMNFKAISQ
jgi:GDP-L-fucose synthase